MNRHQLSSLAKNEPTPIIFDTNYLVADRRSYVNLARQTIPEGGHLIIASFADDRPERCSNLDVCRYNAETMAVELGKSFSAKEAKETHNTPWGSSQPFFYGVFRRQ